MTENRSATEGTIRDSRPGESPNGSDVLRPALAVLNVSHERFRILKTYAQGGLGVVSIAHDVELDRTVAVKEMRIVRPSDDDVQRFLLEARLTGQLDHPGIPPVYAIGFFEDGRPFYAMRLVDGDTLRSAIKEFHAKYPPPDRSRQRSLDFRQLIGAVVRVCHTLRFAHSKGVLHRDIKPSNIMLGEYGETLLMDWGLAKSQKQTLPYSDMEAKAYQQRKRLEDPEDTGTGSVMGTPHYMSPEQATGDVDSINQRSEVYSVGATLYSVLTGKPPFDGQTRDEILAKVRRGDMVPPRALDARVPHELNAICLKAMALERGDRYADTGELATDIEHWLADETVSCYREPRSRRWQRWVRTHQAWVAGLVALMATCFLGLVIGTYLVSVKHHQAVEASHRADAATVKAETIAEQSRNLLARTFVSTFNSRIRNLPGTEQTRLQVLQLFIEQFEEWSKSGENNSRDQHELANAIYERSLIYNELNQLDLAWADLQRARSILDNLVQSTDRTTRSAGLLDRMHLMTEVAKMCDDMESSEYAAQNLLMQVQHWATRESDANSQMPVYQFQLARITSQLGQSHARLGNYNTAFEFISRAAAIFTTLQSPQFKTQLDEQMVQGTDAVELELMKCRIELAKVAWQMGDWDFARREAQSVDEWMALRKPDSVTNLEAWILMIDNQLSLSRFGTTADDIALDQLQRISHQLEREMLTRPNHRRLWQLQLQAAIQLAAHRLFLGDIDEAWTQTIHARRTCVQLQSMAPNKFRYRRETEMLDELALALEATLDASRPIPD